MSKTNQRCFVFPSERRLYLLTPSHRLGLPFSVSKHRVEDQFSMELMELMFYLEISLVELINVCMKIVVFVHTLCHYVRDKFNIMLSPVYFMYKLSFYDVLILDVCVCYLYQ